jgi:NTP pyrophosphatase (non-canonical NTP hydrolase)
MSELSFNEYQKETKSTAIYPADKAVEYTVLGLLSEAGEVAGKVKKVIRDNDGIFSEAKSAEIADECGDVIWYLARVLDEIGYTFEEVAADNLRKLKSRQQRGVIGGSGDNR